MGQDISKTTKKTHSRTCETFANRWTKVDVKNSFIKSSFCEWKETIYQCELIQIYIQLFPFVFWE